MGLLIVIVLTANIVAAAEPALLDELRKLPLGSQFLSFAKEIDQRNLADQRDEACRLVAAENIEFVHANIGDLESEIVAFRAGNTSKYKDSSLEELEKEYEENMTALRRYAPLQEKCNQLTKDYQNRYGK